MTLRKLCFLKRSKTSFPTSRRSTKKVGHCHHLYCWLGCSTVGSAAGGSAARACVLFAADKVHAVIQRLTNKDKVLIELRRDEEKDDKGKMVYKDRVLGVHPNFSLES